MDWGSMISGALKCFSYLIAPVILSLELFVFIVLVLVLEKMRLRNDWC